MKQVLALAVVSGVVVSMAMAAEVRSINTVGYHGHTVDPGDLILVSPTVDNLNGNTLEDLLGAQLPVNSAVFVWNGTGYDPPATRTVFFGWSPNLTVMRGQAFFVQNSGTAPGPTTFAFTGEVPEARNAGGTTTVTVTGLDATAYPYPIDIEFGQTEAAQAAAVNSAVFFWNVGTQAYDPPTSKTVFFGWGAAETRVVNIGEAFFMEATSPINVDEVQPYDLSI